MSDILRTSRDGCYHLATNSWGTFLQPCADPEADTVITKEQKKGFELNDDIVPIPADLWERWIQLCFELTRRNSANLEVSCRLLRNADKTKWRIVVPEQKVTGVSVRVDSFDKAIDIATGEVITQWPPEGWIPAGSSHSHNTMDSFFSGTDDQYELGDPGLHIVVGNIDVNKADYTLVASITANLRRFIIEPKSVVDLNGTEVFEYHPSVLNVIAMPTQGGLISRPTTTFTNFYDYEDYFPASYYQSTSNTSTSLVTDEVNAVLAAVDLLEVACKQRSLDASAVLSDIAFRIDDLASVATDPASDPFYWSV